MMPQYNPFGCDLDAITAEDLEKLRSVAEGWFIEYKGQEVPAKAIAKSLSAFANHYGGWIFYGVDGARDGTNTAHAFPGLETQKALTYIEKIRDAARNSLNPAPHYEYKIIHGPCTKISLADNKSIIIVLVPSGNEAPYIHSDGRIYRRVADASDPKEENDRFILDQLWQRSKKAHEKLASFLKYKPIISEGESENPYLHLFLMHDPLGVYGDQPIISEDQFRSCLSDKHDLASWIVYDNFYSTAGGYIARYVGVNDPYNLTLTWRYNRNGSSIVTIPMVTCSMDNFDDWSRSSRYINTKAFLSHNTNGIYDDFIVIDANQLLGVIIATIGQYQKLLEVGGIKRTIYSKALIENTWRKIPFLDTETYISYIRKYKYPVIQFKETYTPVGIDFDSLIEIEQDEVIDTKEPLARQMSSSITSIIHIALALGLSESVLLDGEWGAAILRAPSFKLPENEK